MRFRNSLVALTCAATLVGVAPAGLSPVRAQQQSQQPQGEGTPGQRITVMRSRLDSLRRSLGAAIAGFNAGETDAKKSKDKKPSDDPATRLRGLDREATQLSGEIADLDRKVIAAEKYDPSQLGKLEAAVNDLSERAERALQETAGARSAVASSASASGSAAAKKKKSGGGFLGLHIFGGGKDDEAKYAEMINGVRPGRDRELFEEAAKLARKSNYEGARLLFETIINTYPESNYLPHSKLAIADTFYLEGSTSSLIQAGNAYQEWLTFFPTDPLSPEVMLKAAEVEMRQMNQADRDITHARKAEQRLKALLQQFPQTPLRPDVQVRLNETQEILGMHSFEVANFYMDKYLRGVAPNPKGAQSRYLEVLKYPNFSRTDKALYMLATTYIAEEQPDEAAKYLQRILREFPDSEFKEKAEEQLDAIGADKPSADKSAPKRVPPPDKGMLRRFIVTVAGTVQATTDKNGVLLSKDSDAPALIDVVIENKGSLPVTTPEAFRTQQRSQRQAVQAAPPVPVKKTEGTDAPKAQPPKNNGQPATGSDPTKPSTPPPGA